MQRDPSNLFMEYLTPIFFLESLTLALIPVMLSPLSFALFQLSRTKRCLLDSLAGQPLKGSLRVWGQSEANMHQPGAHLYEASSKIRWEMSISKITASTHLSLVLWCLTLISSSYCPSSAVR